MRGKIQNLTGRQWFEMARNHGQTNDSFTVIDKGTDQHRAWLAYFVQLGWTPYTLTNMHLNKSGSWTAPCEWPYELPALEFPKPNLKLVPPAGAE